MMADGTTPPGKAGSIDSGPAANDLEAALQRAGLGHLASTFAEAGIDLDIIDQLDDADLRELGLNLGDRKRFRAAFAPGAAPASALAPPRPRAEEAGPARPPAAPIEAERRQVTALFCDLVDSTGWAARLDPEDMRDLLRLYRDAVHRIVARYGGTVLSFAGDGTLVAFGYPTAHEESAEGAIRAGLEIAVAVPAIALPRTEDRLQVRIGIATSTCVVGDIVGESVTESGGVVGEMVHLAARMQSHASPSQVLICPVTHAIAGGRVTVRPVGPVALKGFARPVPCWQAIAPAGARGGAGATRAGAPIFGPTANLDRLLALWYEAAAGHGRVARITGEAGSGKSHLVTTLLDRIAGEEHALIEWHCSQFARNTAFHPVLESLRQGLAAEALPGAAEGLDRRRALHRVLATGEAPAGSGATMNPSERRAAILEMIAAEIAATAASRPTILLLEDEHWADPSTRDAIAMIAGRIASARVLLLITRRDGPRRAVEAEPGAAAVTDLFVANLDRESARALIRHATGDVGLPDAVIDQIVEKGDGVPLYLGEVSRALVAGAAARPEGEDGVPVTLQAALAARLDSLGEGRRIAQLASVFGREFEADLLAELLAVPMPGLTDRLDALAGQRVLRPIVTGETLAYRFTHALIQDAAYESLLRRDRVRLHAEVAALLERRRPALVEAQPELAARHLTHAEDFERAASAWLRACEHAMRSSAHQEALAHSRRALAAIERIGPSEARALLELKVNSALGRTLISTEGHGSEAVRAAFARAEELIGEVTPGPDLFPILWGVNAHHMIRGEVAANDRASARLVDLAEAAGEREQIVVAHTSRALALYYAGRFEEALHHVRTMERHYDRTADPSLAHRYAVDRMVVGLQHGSWVLWMLGRADDAAEMERHLYAHVHEFPHPYSYAQALTSGASVYLLRREPAIMLQRAEAGIAFAEAKGRAIWVDHGDLWRGWALSELGDHEGGLAHAMRALERYARNGSRSSMPKFHCIVAEILLRLGRAAEARRLIEQALERIAELGEQCYRAECLRIQAEALLQTGEGRDVALAALREALAVAEAQKALGWRLRVARDLGRLLLDAQERDAARALLQDACAAMEQGRDTPDMREAQAVLDAST